MTDQAKNSSSQVTSVAISRKPQEMMFVLLSGRSPESSRCLQPKVINSMDNMNGILHENLAFQCLQGMCEIKAHNKISEVEYLSCAIVRAVKFWLWFGPFFFRKITDYRSHFPEVLCKSKKKKKRHYNIKKQTLKSNIRKCLHFLIYSHLFDSICLSSIKIKS